MKWNRDKLRNITSLQWCMLICMLFYCLIQMFVYPGFGDDKANCKILSQMSLWQWIVERYWNWSSRLVIDALVVLIAQYLPILWKVLDIIVMTLLYRNIHKICFFNVETPKSYLLLAIYLPYPYSHMGTAGWITTTINYSWPITFFLFAIIGLIRIYYGEKLKWYEYLGYFICVIFGCSNELIAMISFACFAVAWIYYIYDKKKYPVWYMIISTIISFGSIIFIFTCPGNNARMLDEAQRYMPEFYNISLLHKLGINYIAMLEHFTSRINIIFFLFCVIVSVSAWINSNAMWKKLVACSVMAIDVIYSVYYFVIQHILKLRVSDYLYPVVECTTKGEVIEQIILYIVYTYLLIALILCIFWALKDVRLFMIEILMLGLGFSSRMAVSLSPTMFSSRTRIYMYFYIAIIICIVLTIQKTKLWEKVLMRYFIYLCGVLGGIYNIYLVIKTTLFFSK